MPTIWLPVHNKKTNRKMINMIVAPQDSDPEQIKAIIEAEEEKTQAQLEAMGPKPVATMSKKEVAAILREFVTDRQKRREDPGYKKFF